MTATPERVLIFDTTLRDGEQAPGCSMTQPEKLRVARALAELGVDVIEAGFPAASRGDWEAVNAVAREVQGPIIAGPARCPRGRGGTRHRGGPGGAGSDHRGPRPLHARGYRVRCTGSARRATPPHTRFSGHQRHSSPVQTPHGAGGDRAPRRRGREDRTRAL